jgi:hypothetical protein
MAEDSKEKQDAVVFSVDTVPPPPGEDDAYSAPTKVGDVHPAVLEAMKKAGVNFPAKPEATAKREKAPKPEPPAKAQATGDAMPRLFEETGEDDQPTKLAARATPDGVADAETSAEPASSPPEPEPPPGPAVGGPGSAPPRAALSAAPEATWTPKTVLFGAGAILLLVLGVIAFVAAIVVKGC